jgi:hypothetical protein
MGLTSVDAYRLSPPELAGTVRSNGGGGDGNGLRLGGAFGNPNAARRWIERASKIWFAPTVLQEGFRVLEI